MRLEQPGGVVQQDARGADLRQPFRRFGERFVPAAAVLEARVELAAGVEDRLGRDAQVVDVVERVVEPEDVDAALGRRST